MKFCHNCGTKLTLGSEKFCPDCGTNLQQKRTPIDINNQSIDVQRTTGDVMGAGISGSGNIIAKDIEGNTYNNYFYGFSYEQIKNITTSSTALISQTYQTSDNTARELNNVTQTKQQTAQVIEQINKIEKQEGREIQEIKVGEIQVSKNELLLKELILKGNEFYYKNEYEKSIECYDKALKIDSKYAEAWGNKGVALTDLGKYKEGIEYIDKALEIDPNDATVWNSKAAALNNLGKYNEAIEYIDKALEKDPNDADALHNKGFALNYLGKYNEAIECFNKALKIDPDNANTLSNSIINKLTLKLLEERSDGK